MKCKTAIDIILSKLYSVHITVNRSLFFFFTSFYETNFQVHTRQCH